MNKFLVRTLSGAVYVALVLLAIYSYALIQSRKIGFVIFAAFFLFVAIVGVHEVYKNLKIKGIETHRGIGFVVAILTYGVVSLSNVCGPALAVRLLMTLPFVWSLVALAQLWHHDERPFATIGYTLLPTLWVVLPLVLLQRLWIMNPLVALMMFVCLWANDTFAYLTGMAFGKHHLWQRHSPNKTWEGTIGGALCCMAAAIGLGMWLYRPDAFYGGNLQWWHWAVMGLICSIVGTLGDLVESMFKRSCGVKDSGTIMPGHGGVLDRFDSLFMATPWVVAFFMLCQIVERVAVAI